jgi:hypothetical protein
MGFWKKLPDGLKIILVLTAGGLLAFWGLTRIYQRAENPNSPEITYRVTGTASVSLVTYTREDGSAAEPEFYPLPWQEGPFRFDEPTMVVLTAHNSSQYGTVKCEILKDGRVWKVDEVDNPDLNASCGGYIP